MQSPFRKQLAFQGNSKGAVERPHTARYPPCTSKAIPAARGGTPPAAERCCWGGDPDPPQQQSALPLDPAPASSPPPPPPPSARVSLSGTLEAVVFTAPPGWQWEGTP